jgi:hypothetical protein
VPSVGEVISVAVVSNSIGSPLCLVQFMCNRLSLHALRQWKQLSNEQEAHLVCSWGWPSLMRLSHRAQLRRWKMTLPECEFGSTFSFPRGVLHYMRVRRTGGGRSQR